MRSSGRRIVEAIDIQAVAAQPELFARRRRERKVIKLYASA